MKRISMLFLIPILTVVCTVLMIVKGTGILVLLLWLLGALCVSILHAFAVGKYLRREKGGKGTKRIVAASAVALMLAGTAFHAVAIDNDKTMSMYLAIGLGQTVLCYALILPHMLISAEKKTGALYKTVLAAEGIVTLAFNATLTYFLAPMFSVDAIEFVLLPTSALVLCIFSCFLGRSLSTRYITAKLLLWLAGILCSEYVALWLLGVPHTPPTQNTTTLTIWLIVSAVVFAFALLGALPHIGGTTTQAYRKET